MTAGTGVRHSEFNHAADATTHFLQIWLLPAAANLTPGYEQRDFPAVEKQGRLRLVASPQEADIAAGAVRLNADARLWIGRFDGEQAARLPLDPSRKAYVFLPRGTLTANGTALQAGDALALHAENALTLDHGHDAEVLVFELTA